MPNAEHKTQNTEPNPSAGSGTDQKPETRNQQLFKLLPMPRLAILSTHPIQYNAPWFALLAKEPKIELKVFYTWSQRQSDLFDEKFGKEVKWDIPLLEGYDYSFVENRSKDPGNHHFKGIVCPTLIDEIKSFNPSHLLVFGWNFKAHLQTMRHFKGKIPVLFRGDSTLLDETGGLKTLLRRAVLKFIYRSVDVALYTGKANKAYFKKHGLSEKQLLEVPHAVDNDRFVDSKDGKYTERAIQWRKELNISADDFVFLFIGKFEPVKDLFILLSAFKKLKLEKDLDKSCKLIFVGNGMLEENLKEASDKNEDILFLPFQNQSLMPVVYRLGDVLCLPSKSETWGLVVNEAMASGLKCIVSDKVGCAEDLGVLKGNRVFPAGNVEELALSMKKAISDTKTDRDYFLSNWNYKKMVKMINEIMKVNE